MGLLSDAPDGAADAVNVDDDAADAAQDAPAPEVAPKPETVQLKPSRREAARLERASLEKEVAGLKETVSKQSQDYQRQMADNQAQIARMLGNLEARTSAPQQPAPAQVDPQHLYDTAREALDRGDFSGYQRKFAEAVRAEVVAAMPKPQAAQAGSPGMDPRLQAVIMSTPAAGKVMGHEKGIQMAQVKDQELQVMGVPEGPERWRKAFELAEQSLYGNQTSPASYSTQSRGALSGIPTSRGSAASPAQPSVALPGNWKQWADAAGMSRDEYAKFYAEAHPESVKDE